MSGYFEKELNVPVYHEPKVFSFNGKSFFIGHGDGLGPGDHGYKLLKRVFRNPACKFLFSILPPFLGIGLAGYLSRKSRAYTGSLEDVFLGEEQEWLIQYSKEIMKSTHHDYFIFGHRHLPIDFNIMDKSRYINLGDWINYDSYAVFDGTELNLKMLGK